MRTMGINYASKFIPMMIEKFDKVSKNWKEGKWIFFFDEMKVITFEIISSILFGGDIIEKIGLLKYKWTNGSVFDLNLELFNKNSRWLKCCYKDNSYYNVPIFDQLQFNSPS